MTTPTAPRDGQVLRRDQRGWLFLPVLLVAAPMAVTSVHLSDTPDRAVVYAVSVLLVALMAGMSLWMAGQAVVLDGDELRGRWLPGRPRVPRDDVADVELTPGFYGTLLTVVRRSGARTAFGLQGSRRNAELHAATIRDWAGLTLAPTPTIPDVVDGQAWSVTTSRSQWGLLAGLAVVALLVPVSSLWHRVPWWGWLSMTVTMVGVALLAWRLAPTRTVTLAGDELVVQGRRRTVVAARRVRRVVSLVTGTDPSTVFVDVEGGDPVHLPVGPDDRLRAAMVQRWAEQHGGGAGAPGPFVPRRNWRGVLATVPVMAGGMGSIIALFPGDPGSMPTVAVTVFLFQFVVNLRQPDVRDWSER